ncbi:relaxase/mobilization nuclease domain-containing protein [Solitalea lacus]|uniref:relaxase/mobilization nuclease domain-containing protein n=1 Tax=Solitalea lacus TaxID=2911172 RepID=UPI001EDBFA37|nr:relaxase/mobilization nuclease domain-containing protein [Solitalea lacus]UKJ09188.1 relaxase/mobilization nuclease domain-containing protein [Solitalea lacus]
MIGKQLSGRSFKGCLRYLVLKPEAVILESQGVSALNVNTLIRDFDRQRKLNPNLGKAVGHLILSWSKEDKAKLSATIMKERAKEYLNCMNIRDTQFVIIQHKDREHAHLHIVYNRVANNGKTISDANNWRRNVNVCKELTLKYGYYLGRGKGLVNRKSLRGKDGLRYELYDSIHTVLRTSSNWEQLEAALLEKGIMIQYKYQRGTNTIQGISFGKDGIVLKGSAIDRSLSYACLNKQLLQNRIRLNAYPHSKQASLRLKNEPAMSDNSHQWKSPQSENLLEVLLKPEHSSYNAVSDFEWQFKRKKKKKKKRQSL